MASALDGIRVLDLTRLYPGPFCTMLLADFGAEVIKIEDPQMGDYLRWSPPLAGNFGAAFSMLNRNKKGLRLDLRSEAGREIFLALAERSDVVVEGFRPGVVERLGIDAASVRERNARIVYCSITGYGQTGPYRTRAGHDLNYVARAGLLGSGEETPHPPPLQVADFAGGGLQAAFAILVALFHRERSGQGQSIDVSMREGVLSLLGVHAAETLAGGGDPAPARRLLGGQAPCYNVYRTADGRYMALGALEPKFWAEFCRVIGREDLIEAQFSEGETRKRQEEEIARIFAGKTQAQWVECFKGRDVCCEPVLPLSEALDDPEFAGRRLHLDPPTADLPSQLRATPLLSETPATYRAPAPLPGEHTREILRSIGLGDEEIESLEKRGIV
ncbi:MAG: CoA transferase [Deltaproteobacteria bacterium]|nr:MAG: CoA transferase [Deltaproteobacteria bacterium]